MRLTELKPVPGSRKTIRRVGRGIASGAGKTCNRGHRGQGARSGESKRFGFEGGQTPLFRRLPKIHTFGFVKRRKWVPINIGRLNALPKGTEVTPQSLFDHKIVDKLSDSVRILGVGELTVALSVKAHHFSQGAINKIQQAGGSYEVLQPATPTRGRRPVRS
ncbi:MAG: 50S ribosomal protein L15 [Candidatus Obscuribacterales bacterium]|nr:50S ribosomal protein L15 [Candidatus Obscuribacterales bacterium]